MFQWLNAQVFIVPREIDNSVLSEASLSDVVITNSTPTVSAFSTISSPRYMTGQMVNFRCILVPKERKCIPNMEPDGVTPIDPIPNVTVISSALFHPSAGGGLVNLYEVEAIVESNDIDNWRVCAGATGGLTWDKSEITSTADAVGNVTVTNLYEPNTIKEIYRYFIANSNDPNIIGRLDSYIKIRVTQTCR